KRYGDASALESGLLHVRHGSAIPGDLLKRPGLQSSVERHFQRAGEDGRFGLLDLWPGRLRLGDDVGRALLHEYRRQYVVDHAGAEPGGDVTAGPASGEGTRDLVIERLAEVEFHQSDDGLGPEL